MSMKVLLASVTRVLPEISVLTFWHFRLMPKQTSIMAKKSLQFTPLGPFMTMSGAIFVDRGNNARAVQSLAAAGELMKRLRVSLWMFPEGTRSSSENPEMLPLKKGGFHLAIQAGIPIIPIVTENYWRLYRKGVFDEGSFKVRGTNASHRHVRLREA